MQAADLIGQLGDPLYPRKANALFHEFEEVGTNRQLGYATPADLIEKFPGFDRNSVAMHLGEATTFLDLTARGRQWIANLHHHVDVRRACVPVHGTAEVMRDAARRRH